jgi:hypothetical protein
MFLLEFWDFQYLRGLGQILIKTKIQLRQMQRKQKDNNDWILLNEGHVGYNKKFDERKQLQDILQLQKAVELDNEALIGDLEHRHRRIEDSPTVSAA